MHHFCQDCWQTRRIPTVKYPTKEQSRGECRVLTSAENISYPKEKERKKKEEAEQKEKKRIERERKRIAMEERERKRVAREQKYLCCAQKDQLGSHVTKTCIRAIHS
jgi:signal transduction histidine kinase